MMRAWSPSNVLSLIFVGLQVRLGAQETESNTKALLGQTRESLLSTNLTQLLRMLDYPYLVDYNYDPTLLSQEEQQRATVFWFTFQRSRENYWSQKEAGILDTPTYLSYRSHYDRIL